MCKKCVLWIFVGSLLLLWVTSASALTVIPEVDWWRVPGDPEDGVTRTQYHSFITDPNLELSPDYTYDGYDPNHEDSWETSIIDQWGQDIPDDNPFQRPDGQPYGDGMGAHIGQAGDLTKFMGNASVDYLIKQIYACIIWQGTGDLAIGLTSEAGTTINVTQQDITDGSWHASFLTGSISPQPDFETFFFTFDRSSMWVDSVWVGTHCVPEPCTMLLLSSGLIGLIGFRKKFKK